jgi:hypothetical protein
LLPCFLCSSLRPAYVISPSALLFCMFQVCGRHSPIVRSTSCRSSSLQATVRLFVCRLRPQPNVYFRPRRRAQPCLSDPCRSSAHGIYAASTHLVGRRLLDHHRLSVVRRLHRVRRRHTTRRQPARHRLLARRLPPLLLHPFASLNRLLHLFTRTIPISHFSSKSSAHRFLWNIPSSTGPRSPPAS